MGDYNDSEALAQIDCFLFLITQQHFASLNNYLREKTFGRTNMYLTPHHACVVFRSYPLPEEFIKTVICPWVTKWNEQYRGGVVEQPSITWSDVAMTVTIFLTEEEKRGF